MGRRTNIVRPILYGSVEPLPLFHCSYLAMSAFEVTEADVRSAPNSRPHHAVRPGPFSANGGHASADLEQAINERTAMESMNALPMLS
jgi:hypothetical protein